MSRVALTLALGASVAGAQQINTGPWNGQALGTFGPRYVTTMGMTFEAPVGYTVLDQFTFQLYDPYIAIGIAGNTFSYEGFLMQWDVFGGRAIGPVLYQSGFIQGTNSPLPLTYTFGGAPVTPGDTYVAFVSSSNYIVANPSADGQMALAYGSVNPSLTTRFVYTENGGDFASLTTDAWFCSGGSCSSNPDPVFSATFSNTAPVVTPEPASVVLLGTGLVAVLAFGRRRQASS